MDAKDFIRSLRARNDIELFQLLATPSIEACGAPGSDADRAGRTAIQAELRRRDATRTIIWAVLTGLISAIIAAVVSSGGNLLQ